MDAAAIRNCIAATLDADADARRRAELQLKQVRLFVSRPGRLVLVVWRCRGTRCAPTAATAAAAAAAAAAVDTQPSHPVSSTRRPTAGRHPPVAAPP